MNNQSVKVCTKCKLEKTLDDYGVDNSVKSGLRSVCNKCKAQEQREFKKRKLEEVQELRKHIELPKNKECRVCKCVKCLSDFYANKYALDGKQKACKACTKITKKLNKSKRKEATLQQRIDARVDKKRCSVCKERLLLKYFTKNKSAYCGLSSACRECSSKRRRERKTQAGISEREHSSIYRKSARGRYSSYKASAKQRNLGFYLTFDQFKTFWGMDCYYCGLAIETIGIDRLDNKLGYELKNLVPCCTTCNRMKMAQTLHEFIDRCLLISSKHFSKGEV